MAISIGTQREENPEKSRISDQDLRSLLIVCTEFVNLCAKLTGKIDPAATTMLANVMDVLVSGNKSKFQ
jgi:hypothetical protein